MSKIYTLRRGNKSISLAHRQRHYVIGFRDAITARKVHYSIHPEPKFTLVRENSICLSSELSKNGFDIELDIDVMATLFIPKCKGSTLEPMNDGGFHLHMHDADEFMMFPFHKNLGIVVPYRLEDESAEEFMYKAYVIDPCKNVDENTNVQ